METLETRFQKRRHIYLYALVFLIVLLGLSVILEGIANNEKTEVRSYSSWVTSNINSVFTI